MKKLIISNNFFVLFSTVLLCLGFYGNFWDVVDDDEFNKFNKGNESLVVGRLAYSENEGIFSKAGLTGRYSNPTKDKGIDEYQYEIYNENLKPHSSTFGNYKSQSGGQAITFSILDKISPLQNRQNLKIFEMLTAVLTALVFSLFLLWCRKRYGIFAAFIALFLLLVSQWPTLFGRNLWWVLWSFYIPFLTLLWLFEKETKSNQKRLRHIRIAIICFITVLIKCFFTGFEYMTTVLIMLSVPLVFYAILYKWNVKFLFQRFLSLVLGALSATLVSMVILIIQISTTTGSTSSGFKHLILSFTKRTSGTQSVETPIEYQDSLNSNLSEVLQKYWNGSAINLNEWSLLGWENLWDIEFGELLLIFLFFSALAFVAKNLSPTTYKNGEKNKALIITTWFSIIAPLSWFVIFKGHSYIHTHMNFIVWYMPFCLFGYASIGSVFYSLLKDIKEYYITFHKTIKKFFIVAVIILTLSTLLSKSNLWSKDYELYKQITTTENFVAKHKNFRIYIYNNEIYYLNQDATNQEQKDIIFLHLFPKKVQDLPVERRIYGFENLDLSKSNYDSFNVPFWVSTNQVFVAHKKLPEYEIKKINTGQINKSSRVWSTSIELEKSN